MLSRVFLKTIYEKRWMLIGWSFVTIAFTAFIVLIYPVFRDALGESMAQIPESLKGFMGDKTAYQTLNGFVDMQVIYQMVFMPVIMGIILCSNLIAGKQEQGVLQSLLVQPVKRSKVYVELMLASAVIIGIVSFTIFVSTWVCALIINEPLNVGHLIEATISVWLISMLVSFLAYAIGAITGKRGFSGMLAGVLFFIAYIITSLAPSVKYLKIPNYFSPFKYFNTPSVMLNGLQLENVLILLGITLLFLIVGFVVFVKHDIYQR